MRSRDHRSVPVGPASRRGLRLALIPAALVVALASCASPPPEPPPGPTLTAMSFNIRHGVGADGRLDLDRVAAAIAASEAEVVGLQEVDRHFSERSNFVDQATYLAGLLGMQVVFGPNLDLPPLVDGLPRRQYGNAILSRSEIRSSRNVLLPRLGASEQRGLLIATTEVGGAEVTVLSTHLQFDAPAERLLQVEAIVAEMASIETNVVLLGDLNAEPGSPEVGLLAGRLTDAWAAAGTGDGYTYSVSDPHKRVDYVFSSDGLAARTAMVVDSDASDHRPVVATFALSTLGTDPL